MRFLIDMCDSNLKLLRSISVEADSAEEAQDQLEDDDIPEGARVWWVQNIETGVQINGEF